MTNFTAPKWTDEELAAIRLHYPVGGSPECAPHIPNRSPHAIKLKAYELGLKVGEPGLDFPKPETAAPARAFFGAKRWCGQCERNVVPDEAWACSSQWCKAKAVAA
jgi:hypothetical protein